MHKTAIRVRKELYAPAPDGRTSEHRSQRYVNGRGLRRVEHRILQRESDWSNADFERYSDDNGRTWSDWLDVGCRMTEKKGEDEVNAYLGEETDNPHHGHFVSLGMRRIFFGGHTRAYDAYWRRGEAAFVDHCLLTVRPDGRGESRTDLIKYEDGADYDPENWRNPAYADHNHAYFGSAVEVLGNARSWGRSPPGCAAAAASSA